MSGWDAVEGAILSLGSAWIEEESAYNFSLYSRHASQVALLLFGEEDAVRPTFKVSLRPAAQQDMGCLALSTQGTRGRGRSLLRLSGRPWKVFLRCFCDQHSIGRFLLTSFLKQLPGRDVLKLSIRAFLHRFLGATRVSGVVRQIRLTRPAAELCCQGDRAQCLENFPLLWGQRNHHSPVIAIDLVCQEIVRDLVFYHLLAVDATQRAFNRCKQVVARYGHAEREQRGFRVTQRVESRTAGARSIH